MEDINDIEHGPLKSQCRILPHRLHQYRSNIDDVHNKPECSYYEVDRAVGAKARYQHRKDKTM